MLKDLGIKSRVLVLTLLPATVLAVVLGIYFTWMQLSEMRHQLDERGQLVAQQLARWRRRPWPRGTASGCSAFSIRCSINPTCAP